MRARMLAVVAILAVAAPSRTEAQWSQAPNGQLQYTTDYNTTGGFRCSGYLDYLPGTTCSLGSSSLTLTTGESAVTFIFHPFVGSITVVRNAATSMAFGDIETRFSGPTPYAFPTPLGSYRPPLAILDITLHVAGPTGGIGDYTVPFIARQISRAEQRIAFYGCDELFCAFTAPIPPTPNGYAQSFFAIGPSAGAIAAADGRATVRASVSIIPEPGTWVLLATGLVGLGAVARRSRVA